VKNYGRLLGPVLGGVAVGLAVGLCFNPTREVRAANDRYDDYIMCTGAAAANPNVPTDAVWLLDYRAGKLLGTIIDRTTGKIGGWAEVDLVTEFGLPPRQNVHFLMTTGMVGKGQAALYVAETTSGKFGVYMMGNRGDNQPGVQIKRLDQVSFRADRPN
jgi:hypothetical protein